MTDDKENEDFINQNEARKEKLKKLINSGEAILFVGSGSSALIGYPTWPKLIDELENLGITTCKAFNDDVKKKKDSLDSLNYAQLIKDYLISKEGEDGKNKYFGKLYELFKCDSPKNPIDFHKILVILPFKGIVTTNYDKVLEKAMNFIYPESSTDNCILIDGYRPNIVYEFILSLVGERPKCIAHLHGIYDDPKDIVLTIKDYIKTYGPILNNNSKLQKSNSIWTFHRKIIWSILTTRRVVFVGFSMKDPYIKWILENICYEFWNWNKTIHFVILPKEEALESHTDLRNKYGIGTVFFEVNYPNDYSELIKLFNDISQYCSKEEIQKEVKKISSFRHKNLLEINSKMTGGI